MLQAALGRTPNKAWRQRGLFLPSSFATSTHKPTSDPVPIRINSGASDSMTAYAPFFTFSIDEFGRFGRAWRVSAKKVGIDSSLDRSTAAAYAPDVSLPSAGRMTAMPGIIRIEGIV